MKQSLYTKLVLIMLLLITTLMLVVGVFLVNGISNYFAQDFYEQMQSVFAEPSLSNALYSATENDDAPDKMAEILGAYAGRLGIDSDSRNFYILSKESGEVLSGSLGGISIGVTPNVLTAMNGESGYTNDVNEDFMDVALPIEDYIVWILDNESVPRELESELRDIILIALATGLFISALLSLVLAKALVAPILDLTSAAERVAEGHFDARPVTIAKDEIGTLTTTFNNMANQLEATLVNLTKSEAMRREFVANVSHELRTPITSIRSYAETLSDNISQMPEETEQEFLHVIVTESDRMTKIVQDLLTLSRFDAGSIEFEFEDFSFGESVRDVFNAMALEAQRQKLSFKLDFKNEIGNIRGDRARIEQVLMNFVSNAIKYTPAGGKIKVSAGKAEDFAWVSVEDNGIGIPKSDIGRVFDRFYRVDKARSRESGGTGLGLSIASEIVHRHDGKITLNSNPGKGTTITMTLPISGAKEKK